MHDLTLYIGNKNLSSWSLRPWLLMKQADIPFEEVMIRLDIPEERKAIADHSPSGKVPALVCDGQTIWDSFAIAEFLHDLFPERGLWPENRKVRAIARCISAEMHSGFQAMRDFWPMNYSRSAMGHLCPPPVRRDVERVTEIWTMCRKRFGAGGPFLFGRFSIADAMFAPVVSRMRTYGPLDLNDAVTDYCQSVWTLPAMREWGESAKAELAREAL